MMPSKPTALRKSLLNSSRFVSNALLLATARHSASIAASRPAKSLSIASTVDAAAKTTASIEQHIMVGLLGYQVTSAPRAKAGRRNDPSEEGFTETLDATSSSIVSNLISSAPGTSIKAPSTGTSGL